MMNQESEIELILDQCGVTETTLAAAQKESLDRDGYVVLPAVIDAKELDHLRKSFESPL